jgi:hypothetical protein
VGTVNVHGRGLPWRRWWRVGPKLFFDQMAAPVPEVVSYSLYMWKMSQNMRFITCTSFFTKMSLVHVKQSTLWHSKFDSPKFFRSLYGVS